MTRLNLQLTTYHPLLYMFRYLPIISSAPSYRFLLFLMVMFFIFVADSIMSYVSPLIIEEVVGSSTKMGFILAISSVVGMIVDFSFAQFFSKKRAFFFQRVLFFCVFLFPLSFLISPSFFSLAMAMAWWGLSYEAMVFCTYHAIHEAVGRVQHAWAWGLVSILRNVSLTIGPLIASVAYEESVYLPLFYAIILNAIGLFLFFLYLRIDKKHRIAVSMYSSRSPFEPRKLIQTLKIWKSIIRVIWPLLLFFLCFYFFDSAVFSIGPLLTEKLKDQHIYGGLFVSLYGLPGIISGFFIQNIAKPFGKKKVVFITGMLAGVCALLMGFQSVTIVLIAMFLTSLWLSIFNPEMVSIFEDLVARSDVTANDLISITAITGSLGYVIGPILNGVLNDLFGEVRVFQIWGVLLALCGAWLYFSFPRKIKLPQKEVAEIMG